MARLWRSTLIFSSLTMLSRVFGLIRDMVITAVFGAGPLMDAFLVAFKIPNFLRRLFAEGAFSQAFVPVLSDYKTNQSHEEVRRLISRTSGSLLLILTAITVVVMIAAPYVVMVFAPGFIDSPEQFALTTDLLRVTFPYLLLISLTAFASGVLNAYDSFAMPALAPVFLNLSFIGFAVFGTEFFSPPIMALGWAVFVAGILQFLLQLPELWQKRLLSAPIPDFKHPGVRRILKLMLPALFGVSVTQINLLLNTVFASLMVAGSVTWLYAAERLSELPMGLIGIAIGTVILPSLATKFSSNDTGGYQKLMDWALRVVVVFGVPASFGLFMLSYPLVDTLFGRGAFTDTDVLMSTYAIRALSFGVIAFMLIKVFAPGFYARQDTSTPVKVGLISVSANIIFNALLLGAFWMLGVKQLHVALALSSTLAAFVNAGLLYRALVKQNIFHLDQRWIMFSSKIAAAALLMSGAIYLLNFYYPVDGGALLKVGFIGVSVVCSAIIYAGTLIVLGMRPTDFKAV